MNSSLRLAVLVALVFALNPAASSRARNRAPAFPIGLYDVPLNALQDMAHAGFNTVVNAYYKEPGYLERARALKLTLVPYVDLDHAGDFAQEPSIGPWYLVDEPDLNNISPERVHDMYQQLKKADPSRPALLTVWSPSRYADFMESCDIFAVDPYPIVKESAQENDQTRVSRALDTAKALAHGKAVWTVVQAFWALPWWERSPTPQELRAMTYLAISHGTQGIVYFAYDHDNAHHRSIVDNAPLFKMMKRLNRELAQLAPFLNSAPQKIPQPGSRIDVALLSSAHTKLLIAVNPDPRAAQSLVELPALGWRRRLRMHAFEVRVIRLSP
jgi:hypothetical protein